MHVWDLSNLQQACLKIVKMQHPDDVDKKRRNAVQAELKAYQTIEDSRERCDFIMRCLGSFEESDSWYFVMVSGRVLPSAV